MMKTMIRLQRWQPSDEVMFTQSEALRGMVGKKLMRLCLV